MKRRNKTATACGGYPNMSRVFCGFFGELRGERSTDDPGPSTPPQIATEPTDPTFLFPRLPDSSHDLSQRANQRQSNAIGVVGGGSQTQRGCGVRGFRGHSIDRDNFPPKCRMNLFLGVGGYRSRFLNHRNDPPINTATHKNQASNSVPLAQGSAGGSRLTLPFNATSRHDPSSDNDRLLKALINE